MKLAFSTLACPDWSLERTLERAQRFGYEGIELRLLDGQLIGPDLDVDARRRVAKGCSDAGIPIVCVDTSVRIAQPDAEERAAQVRAGLEMIELAAEWHAPLIRVFAGPPAGVSMERAIAGAVECLHVLGERGRELGIAVALETHDAFAASDSVAVVLREVPGSGAGALWDILHPYRMGEAPVETLDRLRDRLLHVHIKDGRRPVEGNGNDWVLTPLGEGGVPVGNILAALHRSGYDGWLAVEWEKKWHPELAEPEVALPQHAALLRDYLSTISR
ncbi:MAG: sugar phosphate isomerase/epimerase family protein [Ktedonobacterales bacterium]